ncbi:MAG TPA: hypothetical protein VME47_08140 [Acetobacteraceae bacterium]|nr:hypothetical protein [Acetobacteraceae bacterium]
MLLLGTLLLLAGPALAQEARAPKGPPARIDNVWGGFDHQPTQSEVESAERARGIAPSKQEQQRDARTVRQLYQELLGNTGAGGVGTTAG